MEVLRRSLLGILVWSGVSLAIAAPPFPAFNNLDQVDVLLQYWGEEAADNINNTTGSVDALSPLFNTSIDWHSSVHGHFAAMFSGTSLSDTAILDRVTSQYTEEKVLRELNFNSQHEQQYGYPWLLLYGVYLFEHSPEVYQTLKPLLTRVYQNVIDQVQSLNYSNYVRSLSSGYRNYNFMLLALYRYAEQTGDTVSANLAKDRLTRYAPYVDWGQIGSGDFFAPKAIAAMAYDAMDVQGVAWEKLETAYQNDPLAVPNVSALAAHSKGRVVTVAWGAWVMYERTQKTRYLDAYIAMLNAVYQDLNRSFGRAGYFGQIGHWVPHFGVIALKLAKESDIPQPDDPQPEEPVEPEIPLLTSISVTPATFTSYVNVTYPCPASSASVRFDIVDWLGRVVRSKSFACSERNNLTENFAGLSSLRSGNYTLNVTIQSQVQDQVQREYSQRIRRKFSWFGWW